MDKGKTLALLNSLVEINNDRIEGYHVAIDDTYESDLKSLFSTFIKTSIKCRAELAGEVIILGGVPAEGTNASAKLHQTWMDLKALITGNDRVAILNSCEYGENAAIETYNQALIDNGEDLNTYQVNMLIDHRALIKADLKEITYLRDMIQTANNAV